MAKWCNYYNCWHNDLEIVIEEIECDEDCRTCKYKEEIEYKDEHWW